MRVESLVPDENILLEVARYQDLEKRGFESTRQSESVAPNSGVSEPSVSNSSEEAQQGLG